MPELPWIFTRLDIRAIIDILAVALIFFWLLWVAQGTRATQLIRGLAILIIAVVGAANIFNLTALNWLLSRALPLHCHRPQQHVAREAVAQTVQHVADHRPRGRSDDADGGRQIGNGFFARWVE